MPRGRISTTQPISLALEHRTCTRAPHLQCSTEFSHGTNGNFLLPAGRHILAKPYPAARLHCKTGFISSPLPCIASPLHLHSLPPKRSQKTKNAPPNRSHNLSCSPPLQPAHNGPLWCRPLGRQWVANLSRSRRHVAELRSDHACDARGIRSGPGARLAVLQHETPHGSHCQSQRCSFRARGAGKEKGR